MDARQKKSLEGYVNTLEKVKLKLEDMKEVEETKQSNMEDCGREDEVYDNICEAVDALETSLDSLQEAIDSLEEIL